MGYTLPIATGMWQTFRTFARMKNVFLNFLAILVFLAISLVGCDNSSQLQEYTVTCTVQGQHRPDSATLLVLEEAYGKLRLCGTAHAVDGTFSFKGQTDRARVALIRWGNDSTRPFYFVLEGGRTGITIKPGLWTITGSRANSDYLHYINRRKAIMDERVNVWQEYLKMAADSSLKPADERRMVARDSLLNDSLQRLTVERINRGDAVGRIVKERYSHQLDTAHTRLLK